MEGADEKVIGDSKYANLYDFDLALAEMPTHTYIKHMAIWQSRATRAAKTSENAVEGALVFGYLVFCETWRI